MSQLESFSLNMLIGDSFLRRHLREQYRTFNLFSTITYWLDGLCMQIGICSLQAKWIQVNLLKTTNLKLYPIRNWQQFIACHISNLITNYREWPCREPWIPLKCGKTADSWAQRTENYSRHDCTLRCNCHDGCTSSACCLSLSVMWLGIKILHFKVSRIQNCRFYTGNIPVPLLK
jgi:hypothetical protein